MRWGQGTTGSSTKPSEAPDLEIRWDPVSKKIFSALLASVWSENKGGARPPGPLPGSATETRQLQLAKTIKTNTVYDKALASCNVM